jgi:hypothetical protein
VDMVVGQEMQRQRQRFVIPRAVGDRYDSAPSGRCVHARMKDRGPVHEDSRISGTVFVSLFDGGVMMSWMQ